METPSRPPRLSDLPLWRLLVMLDDTERTIGPDTQTARTIARIISDRMREERRSRKAVRA